MGFPVGVGMAINQTREQGVSTSIENHAPFLRSQMTGEFDDLVFDDLHILDANESFAIKDRDLFMK